MIVYPKIAGRMSVDYVSSRETCLERNGALMCGIVGLLIRDPALEPELGTLLAQMLASLGDRGPDSTGIAVYSQHDPIGASSSIEENETDVLRISLASEGAFPGVELQALLANTNVSTKGLRCFPNGAWLSVPVSQAPEAMSLIGAHCPSIRVIGVGTNLSVVKDIGRPEDVCERYEVERWRGSMAIGHTRMATESAVTVLHCHPFVPAANLCVVHNGSFSNHASVRRRLQAEGIEFDSDNDSEVAARLIAKRLALGDDLEEATRWLTKEMDGFFTMVITNAEGMTVVRDAFACKPAVVAETSRYVVVASEYRALAGLPGIEAATVYEPEPEEVYTWKR